MTDLDFDRLSAVYKQAVDHWVDAIRKEESLATADHSIVQMEHWDDAALAVEDAESAARAAREAYKDALRKKNYGF